MTSEHLNKKSQNKNFEETALTREKNMVTNTLDRKTLFQEGFKKGFKDGFKSGKIYGEKEGEIDAKIEGRKEGKKESREKDRQAIILKMIELNYSLSKIIKLVKCPKDEPKKLMK